MVKLVTSSAEFQKEISTGSGLVVVDFYADWCGPCKAIAPVLEELSKKYPMVKFLKVNVDNSQDIAGKCGVSAMPTFLYYKSGTVVDTLKGADPRSLEAKIVAHKVDIGAQGFAGKGFSLASSTTDPHEPPLSSREARLKAFGHIDAKQTSGAHKDSTADSKTVKTISTMIAAGDDDDALAQAIALSIADTKDNFTSTNDDKLQYASEKSTSSQADNSLADEDMVPVPVDDKLLADLVEMGFPDVRCRKAILHGKSLEGALGWLDEHQDDPDIDQPYMVRREDALKEARRQIPLTEEEKAQKLTEYAEKAKRLRLEREKREKDEEIKREKERRSRGQKMDNVAEEREKIARKVEMDKMKREKEDVKKERERLRAEIARDKEIRKLNSGVMPSVLGVDGYNPSAIQYGSTMAPSAHAQPPVSDASSSQPKVEAKVSHQEPVAKKPTLSTSTSSVPAGPGSVVDLDKKIIFAIQLISRYRTSGDGGQALKLLVTFLKNIVEQPDDPKFKSINMESNAFKAKLSPIAGPIDLLLAVGFERQDDGKLKYAGSDPLLLVSTLGKLIEAEKTYQLMNP